MSRPIGRAAAAVLRGRAGSRLVVDSAVLDHLLHGAGSGELAVVGGVVLGVFLVLFGFGLEESAAAAHIGGGVWGMWGGLFGPWRRVGGWEVEGRVRGRIEGLHSARGILNVIFGLMLYQWDSPFLVWSHLRHHVLDPEFVVSGTP